MPDITACGDPLASTKALTSRPAVAMSDPRGSSTSGRAVLQRPFLPLRHQVGDDDLRGTKRPCGLGADDPDRPRTGDQDARPWGYPALRIVVTATDSGSSSAAASSDMESGTLWANSVRITHNCANAPSIGGVA